MRPAAPSDALEAPLSPPLHVEKVPPDGYELAHGFAEYSDDFARARARLSAVPGPYERAQGAIPDPAGPEPGALTPRRSAP